MASTLPATEPGGVGIARRALDFITVIAGFAFALLIVNLAAAAGFSILGQPGYLHYGKCVASDGTVFRARYNDQFHWWALRVGHSWQGPTYKVKDRVAPDAQCISEDGLRSTATKANVPQLET